MSKKRSYILTTSLGLLLASTAALAGHPFDPQGGGYDYGIVEDVQELTRIVQVPASREQCWEEPVTYYDPGYRAQPYSYTSTLVGGIVGAVVGNQFGRGSGKDWATVAGTALGASVGRDYGNRSSYQGGYSYRGSEQRCRTVQDYRQEERADGYRVTYSYNGRRYVTQVRDHPGQRIRLRVSVVPAEY